MALRVLLFGPAREAMGKEELQVELKGDLRVSHLREAQKMGLRLVLVWLGDAEASARAEELAGDEQILRRSGAVSFSKQLKKKTKRSLKEA